jgi:hypothetical protein
MASQSRCFIVGALRRSALSGCSCNCSTPLDAFLFRADVSVLGTLSPPLCFSHLIPHPATWVFFFFAVFFCPSFHPFTSLFFFTYCFQSLMVLDHSKRVRTLSRRAREVLMQQVDSASAPLPLPPRTVAAQTSGAENVVLQHDSSHISVCITALRHGACFIH